jgi:Flp pilus assembly protein TadG
MKPIHSRQKRPALRGLLRDRRGATAVEFALLVVPFMIMLIFGIQASIIYFLDQALQSVAQSAARQLMTGSAQDAGLTQAQFKTAVCNIAGSIFTCGNIYVDVQSGQDFSSITTTTPTITYNASGVPTNTWSYSPGGPGDIVITRVMYDWPVVGGVYAVGLANQGNGSHLMIATVVSKNEPYQ